MKKHIDRFIIGAVLLLIFMVSEVWSYRCLVTWDPNPAEEDITNYIVFIGATTNTVVRTNSFGLAQTNHVYDTNWNTATNTSWIISNLVDGVKYWISAKAENQHGQSDYAYEISILKPTGPFLVLNGVLEGATNVLGPWETRVTFPSIIYLYATNEEQALRVRLDWSPPTNWPPPFP